MVQTRDHDLYTEEEQKFYPGAVNTYCRVTICTHCCSIRLRQTERQTDRDLIKYLPDSAGDLGSGRKTGSLSINGALVVCIWTFRKCNCFTVSF